MELPLISVVIPFYNAEMFLKRAVNSVVNQTYSSIQIILVDDGSTDKSTLFAKEYSENHPNCRLIVISNSGPGNARNVGIENASGMYIAFLDADDYYHKTAIELYYKNCTKSKADICIGQFTMLDINKNNIKETFWNTNSSFDNQKAIEFVVSDKLIPTSWGKLYTLEIAKECKFPNLSWKEDDVFFLSYLLKIKSVKVINKPLITINCRSNSLTRQPISKNMIADISKSYLMQFEIISSLNKKLINRFLFESEINTFLNLLLLFKLDWNKLENRVEIWNFYTQKNTILYKKGKGFKPSFKKRLLLQFLNLTPFLGWRFSFWVITIFKRNQLIHLKKVKS